eukprot:5361446-Ditylum_brightwellii.AAC.1
MMKVIWSRRLFPAAMESGLVHLVQFGNKKGHIALDNLLSKIIMMDTMHRFCLNGAILNNGMIPE